MSGEGRKTYLPFNYAAVNIFVGNTGNTHEDIQGLLKLDCQSLLIFHYRFCRTRWVGGALSLWIISILPNCPAFNMNTPQECSVPLHVICLKP